MQSACLKIPWKLEGNDLKLSITKVFSLKALWKDLHNAFAILGRARTALRRAKRADLVEAFTKEATSGDYQHLLQTCLEYFVCE